jgi:putative 4-mercaptohistidine N1-methyltranferase
MAVHSSEALTPSSPYESRKLLAEYLLFHYGGAREVLGGLPGPAAAVGFATRLVRELLDAGSLPGGACALDAGCAVGGSSFELARSASSVLGIDTSRVFIAAAQILAESGSHSYESVIEGGITGAGIARVPAGIDRSRVRFEHGDATALREGLGPFDVVLAANLICRLPDPLAFLDRLPALVKRGGQFLLTSPFTWLEDFTPRRQWIGATPESGRSFAALERILEPHFELEHTAELPFLIREHARKFQYTVALGCRWRRR